MAVFLMAGCLIAGGTRIPSTIAESSGADSLDALGQLRTTVVSADQGGVALDIRFGLPRWERANDRLGPCWIPRWGAGSAEAEGRSDGQGLAAWWVAVPRHGDARLSVQVVEEARALDRRPCHEARSEGAAPQRLLDELDRSEISTIHRPSAGTGHVPAKGAIASLQPVGSLRGQAVDRLLVRVVGSAQTEGGGTGITFLRHVRVRVAFPDAYRIERAKPDVPAFDPIVRRIVNHAFMPRYRRGFAPTEAPGAADAQSQTDDPASDPMSLAIAVREHGPVSLSGAQLAAQGWPLEGLDVDRVRLTTGGTTVHRWFTGMGDGRFDPDDRLEFVGHAMDGPYTRDRSYWLQPGGGGGRPATRDVRPVPGVATARVYSRTFEFEEDTEYWASLRLDQGDDRWVWGKTIHAGQERVVTVTLPVQVLPDAAATLRMRLEGFTDDPAVSPDHHVALFINDTAVGARRFEGLGTHWFEFDLPSGTLRAGDHRVRIVNVGDTGADVDGVVLNRLAITAAVTYRASRGRSFFVAPPGMEGPVSFEVTGFESPEITLLDLRAPGQPILLRGAEVSPSDDGGYRLRFTDGLAASARYLAYVPEGRSEPVAIRRSMPSRLRQPDHGADYLIITHPDFAEALQPLVARRREQGMRVATVLVDDVYDEFSHGVFDPRAIREFVQHTVAHWPRPAPTFVLLVGESNLDFLRGYGAGPPNFVPSMHVEAVAHGPLGAFTSDAVFATGENDLIPDVFLGRFSVSTAEEAAAMVRKTLAYEEEPGGAWRERAIMVVDDDGAAAFEPFSEALVRQMPDSMAVHRFHAASYPRSSDIAGDISAAIEEGAFLLNFVGHGNVETWSPWPGGGRIFDNARIRALRNPPGQTLFATATCMNGWIDHPLRATSMAEQWTTLSEAGGPVAFSPSGFTTLGGQERLFEHLYGSLFGPEGRPIGTAAAVATMAMLEEHPDAIDLARMFVLLGDPALVMSAVDPDAPPFSIPPSRTKIILPWSITGGPARDPAANP